MVSDPSVPPLPPLPPPSPALLFSATFRKRIERLCRDSLTDPVRIVVGDLGEANTDITQVHNIILEIVFCPKSSSSGEGFLAAFLN